MQRETTPTGWPRHCPKGRTTTPTRCSQRFLLRSRVQANATGLYFSIFPRTSKRRWSDSCLNLENSDSIYVRTSRLGSKLGLESLRRFKSSLIDPHFPQTLPLLSIVTITRYPK